MNTRLLLALCVAVVLHASVLSLVCDPDCVNGPPAPSSYPALVSQPCNCSEFYLCTDENTATDALPCPPDAPYFDQTNVGVGCQTDPALCTETFPPHTCLTSCSETGTTVIPGVQMIADSSNCSLYYICGLGGVPMGPNSCPSNQPYFSGTGCAEDESQCCAGGSLCDAVCYEAPSVIPDPYDCTKYYVCVVVGPADKLYLQDCPAGENFNPTTSACEAGAPCLTTCTGGTTPEGDGSGDCLTSWTCTEAGYFPKCLNSCEKEYFHCLTDHGVAQVEECPGSLCFSTDPSTPYCISPP